MKSIKNVPNCITAIRIFASFGLLFVRPLSVLFFFFYLVCGISDVFDGYIARKMNASSRFGQVLDSISDLIFIGIVLFIFIPVMKFPFWILCWIAVIASVRLISIIFGFLRYRKLAFLHTYANKAAGIALFFFPFLLAAFGKEMAAVVICCGTSISASEELLINLTSKTLNRDRGSIFSK